MIKLKDGRTELYQWDTGRILTVPADCSQVHYSNNVFGRSIDVPVTDGEAIVPDVLLQTDKPLHVWAFVGTGEKGYTRISKVFKVIGRNKPADYVYTPTEQVTLAGVAEAVATLEGRVERLEALGDGIPEAPIDGKQYARQDAAWTEVQVGTGGGGGDYVLPVSPYMGRKIAFLGDSNTAPNANHTSKKYDMWIEELLGCIRMNYGVNGTGFAEHNSGYDAYTFAKRVSDIDAECTTICVLGGINDTMSSTLGEFGDTTEATVYGGIDVLCLRLKAKFPTADIVFITPPSATGTTGHNAYKVATAIKETANKRGVHVFDFRQWINNPDFTDIHYTSAGHEILGRALADYLCQIKHFAGYNYIRTNSIPATSITLSETDVVIDGIGTYTLFASVTPPDTSDPVIWTSSDHTVAVVENGVITSVGNGTATITATCGGYSASCSVLVQNVINVVPVTGVTLDITSASVEQGDTLTLVATVSPSNASNPAVLWSTSDITIASVNGGVVMGVSAGDAVITVTTADGGFTATCDIAVTNAGEHNGFQVVPDFAEVNYDFSQVQKYKGAWSNGTIGAYPTFEHTGYLGIKAGSYTLRTRGGFAANVFDANFAFVTQIGGNNNAMTDIPIVVEKDGYIGVNLNTNMGDVWESVTLARNS